MVLGTLHVGIPPLPHEVGQKPKVRQFRSGGASPQPCTTSPHSPTSLSQAVQRPFPSPLLRNVPAPSRTQTSHRVGYFLSSLPNNSFTASPGDGEPSRFSPAALSLLTCPLGAPAFTAAHGMRGLASCERRTDRFSEIRDPHPEKGPVQVSQEIKISGGGPVPTLGVLPAPGTQMGPVATSSSRRGIGELGFEQAGAASCQRRQSPLHS